MYKGKANEKIETKGIFEKKLIASNTYKSTRSYEVQYISSFCLQNVLIKKIRH